MYSDALGSKLKGGFGAICQDDWMWGAWDSKFMLDKEPSIES